MSQNLEILRHTVAPDIALIMGVCRVAAIAAGGATRFAARTPAPAGLSARPMDIYVQWFADVAGEGEPLVSMPAFESEQDFVRFRNLTSLDTDRLLQMIREAAGEWPLHGLDVTIRDSRSSDFSGTCFYKTGRIYVNVGRHVSYPYPLKTYLARARSSRGRWWREIYSIVVQDPYQLVLFVFMHELYHWLVRQARRNTRQKEARCDRFAARALVDRHGLVVIDSHASPVARNEWDFQDLDGFVAAAHLTAIRRARLKESVGQPVLAARPAIRNRVKSTPSGSTPIKPPSP